MRYLALTVSTVLLSSAITVIAVEAQAPAAEVAVDSHVDTSVADIAAIVHLTKAYLARPDSTARARGLWSTVDSMDARVGDVARYYAYQGYAATILSMYPARSGDSVYVVKVLHARADSSGREIDVWDLQRLYAVRERDAPFGWKLAGALPRLTRDWRALNYGTIRFHYAPGLGPDTAKAKAAARFVDSLATLFRVAPPQRIEYFVARSPDEYFRALGLDFVMTASAGRVGTGGNAFPEIAFVFAGDSSQGEAYFHELTHIVLRRGFGGAGLGEGLSIWFGGAQGRPAQFEFRFLHEWQKAHPAATIESLLKNELGFDAGVDRALNATAALFVDAVYQRSGSDGLRALATMPRGQDSTIAAMRDRLGLKPGDPHALDKWWRSAAASAAVK